MVPEHVLRAALVAGMMLVTLGAARGEKVAAPDGVGLELAPAYSYLSLDGRSAHGGGLQARAAWRLGDQLALEATGVAAWHAATRGTVSAWGAFVGVRWTMDVLRLEPSFRAGFGAAGAGGGAGFGDAPAIAPSVIGIGLQAGFALDWRVTRRLAVGVEVDWRAIVTALDRVPMWITFGPRIEWRSR